MSNLEWVLLVLGLGAVTYLMRAGLILLLADRQLPDLAVQALRYVAPAVLAALVVSLISDPDAANSGVTIAELAGVVVAVPVAWFTRNLIATLVAGMAVFWLLLAVT